jgi:hypothetical protein
MTISNIPPEDKIDLNEIISEFIQYVNEDSPNLSTDPTIKRIRVIKPDEDG